MGGRQLLTITFCSAFIALPSTADAWSWWSGWDSYAECRDYYAKNPPTEGCAWSANGTHCFIAEQSLERACANEKTKEDEKLRERQKTYRIIVLSCRADSVSEEQFAACVALATGH